MTRRICALLAAALAVVAVLAAAAPAAGPDSTSAAERALGERYEAMGAYYLGTATSMPIVALDALGERYQAMADYYLGLSPEAAQVLGERYEAMADYYRQAELEGLPAAVGDLRAEVAELRADTSGIQWFDVGIGVLIAVGVVGAAALFAFGGYRHSHPTHPRPIPH